MDTIKRGMTYEESYMQCKTLKELEEKVKKDVNIARMINPDRLTVIKTISEKVANLKFGENDC